MSTQICHFCGKPIGAAGKGSITSWIFRSSSCDCNIQVSKTPAEEPVKHAPIVADQAPDESLKDLNLGQRYQPLKMLGQGGMGTVYQVRDNELNQFFAVKVLRSELAADASAAKRFEQEAQAVTVLTHPNLVAVYGHGNQPDGTPYLIMDYLDGESLYTTLQKEGHLAPERALGFLIQVASALAHAHEKGVVHRDMKPSNIMLTTGDSGSWFAKIVDFGIAKVQSGSVRETVNLTASGDVVGSPNYMSPEQCLGLSLDHRSDIYSLGCVMCEVLTGKPPFPGLNPIQTIARHLNEPPETLRANFAKLHVPDALVAVVFRCLAKEPGERYQSMAELKSDLEKLRDGKSPTLLSTIQVTKVPLKRRLAAALIDACVLAPAVALGALAMSSPAYLTFTVVSKATLAAMWQEELVLARVGCLCLFLECLITGAGAVSYVFLLRPSSMIGIPMMLIIAWIYRASLESSTMRGTIGMRLCRFHVTDANGRKLSFWHATALHFARVLLPLVPIFFLIRLVLPGDRSPHQTFLDRLTGAKLKLDHRAAMSGKRKNEAGDGEN